MISTLGLPPKEVRVVHCEFSRDQHAHTHDLMYRTARTAFVSLLQIGNQAVYRNLYTFMELLLRVRQACCHHVLVPERSGKMAELVLGGFEDAASANGEILLDAEEAEALLTELMNVFKKHDDDGGNNDDDNADVECSVCF